MKEQILQELREYLEEHLPLAVDSYSLSETFDKSATYEIEEKKAPSLASYHSTIIDREQPYAANPQKKLPQQTEQGPRVSFMVQGSETDLEDYLKLTKSQETFSTMLLKYIDKTGLSDAEIYKKAGIDRRHFSKIRCSKTYRPKKETAVTLCLALKLSLKQVEELLELAGYSFSSSDTGDLIVKFCIERGIYDLMEVNEALDYFGEKVLGVVG